MQHKKYVIKYAALGPGSWIRGPRLIFYGMGWHILFGLIFALQAIKEVVIQWSWWWYIRDRSLSNYMINHDESENNV